MPKYATGKYAKAISDRSGLDEFEPERGETL